VPEIVLVPTPASAPACHFAGCTSAAPFTPVLCMALVGRERVSRITLPMNVCGGHRERFARAFLTAERRSTVRDSLRSKRRAAPDWARTHIDFVAWTRQP